MQTMNDTRTSLFSIGEIGEILGSYTEGDPGFHRQPISGVSADTRTIQPGDLFVAIKGENFDGHDFLASAFEKGASAAIVSKTELAQRKLSGPRYIAVDDTLFALGELAQYYRECMPAAIVGVTGSNGKTTVKNLIYEIISRRGAAVKSAGNLNNLIGLPLSVFQLRKRHEFAVFELGMSARGEIDRLGNICSPDVAVITNVGPVHLEFLKNVDEVAKAKLEILPHIRLAGTLVVNGDDRALMYKIRNGRFRIIRFGLNRSNEIAPAALSFDGEQMAAIELDGQRIKSRLPGIHNVYNILAAMAVARALEIDTHDAALAIDAYHPEGMRSEIFQRGGVTFFVDCYNANPVSTRNAVETLAKFPGRRIAVLADMLELGEKSDLYHQEIGELCRELGIDQVFGLGPLSKNIVNRYGQGGRHYESKDDLIDSLSQFIKAGDVILFKGSRGMALEEIVDALKKIL